MRRRDFIKAVAGSACAWPLAAGAQQPAKVSRIGYLSPGRAGPRDEAFRRRLQELGYVDGKNIIVEDRFAEGKFDRLPALAQELVRLEVDVIVTAVTQASLAAKHATQTIPIVFVAVSDPLGTGLITSLARPGANVTGTSSHEFRRCGEIAGVAQGGRTRGLPRCGHLEPGQRNFLGPDVAGDAAYGRTVGNRTAHLRGAGSRRVRAHLRPMPRES